MSDHFFPPLPDRPHLDYVGAEFPLPLAVAYARLHAEMDRQEPVASAWQLRDCGEVFVRFAATLAAFAVAVAEAGAVAKGDPGAFADDVVPRLLSLDGQARDRFLTLLRESDVPHSVKESLARPEADWSADEAEEVADALESGRRNWPGAATRPRWSSWSGPYGSRRRSGCQRRRSSAWHPATRWVSGLRNSATAAYRRR